MSREYVQSVDISETHQIATLVEVLVDGEVQEEISAVEGDDSVVMDGAVTMDAGTASRSRLSLTITGVPTMIPTLPTDTLAPYGNELRVSRGIRVAGDEQLVRCGVYPIDRATASDGADGPRVAVSCLDRSGRMTEAKFLADGSVASGTSADDAIVEVLLEVDPDLEFDFVVLNVPLPALFRAKGDDRWAFARGIATACGCELFYGDVGQAVLRRVAQGAQGTPVATIAEGPGGVLLGADRDWDRGPVINYWEVVGENPDNGDDIPVGIAFDDNPLSPTYFLGSFGQKPDTKRNSFVATDTQAAEMAAGLLARSIGAPDVISFESITDPGRRPADVIRVERAKLGIAEDHILDSVAIPLSITGSLSGRTRAAQELS